ncbi:TIGR02234 family membrane protein [Mycobacterium botniense]|nr:TIGR02234 family membrane protein [Mycobacterium botniense]
MIGIAQVLLVTAAAALWAAARLPWVIVRSFDGLGPPASVTLTGAAWSTALRPVALLLLATAAAALAVRGWPLRMLAVLAAGASLAVGYLAVSLWAVPDVAARAADLAHVPLLTLVGSERRYAGAAAALAAAVCTVAAAAVLMRSASASAAKYAAPALRRSMAGRDDAEMSERMIWDALDQGRDPTDHVSEPGAPQDHDSNTEGR